MADKSVIKFYKSKTYADATGTSKTANAVYFTQPDASTDGVHAVVVNGVTYGYGDPMTANRLGVAKVGYTTSAAGRNYAVSIDTSNNLYTTISAASANDYGVVKLGSVADGNTDVVTGGDVYTYAKDAYNKLAWTVGNNSNVAYLGAAHTTLGSSTPVKTTITEFVNGGGMSIVATAAGTDTNGKITFTADVQGVAATGNVSYLKLADNKISLDADQLQHATDTATYTNDKIALACYVDEKIADTVAGGVHYKGLATGSTKPTSPANGDMYKVGEDNAWGITCKTGDILIYKTDGATGDWDLIPAGDDVEYTGVKVGATTIINATTGGDVTFVADDLLFVVGDASEKTVTYSHAVPTNDPDTELALKKIAHDKYGHIYRSVDATQSDIATLLGDYVESIGGATGAITLDNGKTANGDINLTIAEKKISATIVGLKSAAFTESTDYAKASHSHAIADVTGLQDALDGKQDKITDGSATIASVDGNVVTLKAGVAQSGGAIANSTAADITLAAVAKTGEAGDVSFDAGTSAMASTDANAAIIEAYNHADSAIADLDVDSFNLASVSADKNTLTITAIKEVDGKIAADADSTITFTNTNDNQTIKVGTTTFGDNDAVEIAGDSGITVSAANTKITVKHSNSITAGTVGSASKIPVITYDATGHITKTESVDVISAADGKMNVDGVTVFSANTSYNTTLSAEGAIGLTATAATSTAAATLVIGCYWED